MYVSAGSKSMVRSSRAVGVSWDMGMAQGLCVGVWEGSEMVYCTIGSSHLKIIPYMVMILSCMIQLITGIKKLWH